jgi:Zn-dependent protease with chaperone function
MRPYLAILTVVLCAGGAAAQTPSDVQFERRITSELAAQDARAAELFDEANRARDRNDVQKAGDLYRQVEARAPRFAHAFRRHASVELAQEHFDTALGLALKAVEIDPSGLNLATAAVATLGDGQERSRRLPEALRLARRARDTAPNDQATLDLLAVFALSAKDAQFFERVTEDLERLAPDQPGTLFYRALLQAMHEEFADAVATLERAHQRGLTDDRYVKLHEALVAAQPLHQKLLPPAVRVFGAWLAGMVALLLVGLLLSAATLRACRRMPTEAHGHARGSDALLRRVYAGVLWLCCAYYYISLPIMLVIVVVAGGGIIYAMFAAGHIPIKLVLIIAVVVLVTVYSVLKSVFVRTRDVDPGRKLPLEQHPKLRAALDEVAAKVGTRPVDSVYLQPGTEVAVTERGGLVAQMRGASERCLILGVAVLEGFELPAFKAVLAHEYGHFVNRDTAGGGFALLVRRSLFSMASALASGGAATWYNPAWWFVNGFHRVFLRISHGASRLQEVLADRWAAVAYGSASFEHGLRHVVRAGARFDAHVNATLKEVTAPLKEENAQLKPLVNLYRRPLATPLDEVELERTVTEALNRPASPYDSHPPPNDRFRWVKALGAASPPLSDGLDAWSLFSDREGCERLMTTEVRETVHQRFGVEIPGAEATPENRFP